MHLLSMAEDRRLLQQELDHMTIMQKAWLLLLDVCKNTIRRLMPGNFLLIPAQHRMRWVIQFSKRPLNLPEKLLHSKL